MKRPLLILILLTVAAIDARAQAPIRLTVDEAVARGLDASHRLAEMDAREEAAQAVEAQRKAASSPQVSALAGYTRTNHVDAFNLPNSFQIYPDVPDNIRSRVDLQWPIYTAGRLSALTRAAAAEASAVAQDREAARADLKLEITRAYWAVITANASVVVVSESLDRNGAHLNDVRNQQSVGLVPPSDVLTLEAQQARQQQLLIDARNLADNSAVEFRKLVGLAPDTPFELADRIDTPATPSPQVATLVAAALANRSERKALEIRLEGLGQRITAAEAGRMPLIATVAGYDFARPNPKIFPRQDAWKPSWDLGVNFSWTFLDGGRVRAEVAEATANRKAVEERLKEFDETVGVEVRQRAADLASAEAAIAASDVGVRAATEALRVLNERFAAGVTTNSEVLDAQAYQLQAELDRTRALATAHLAAARLDRALGR